MTVGTDSGELRDVAVGATREEAADIFGEHFDDAFFTSYEDFDAEVDLSLLRSLGLVAGDGLSAVLPRVLARHNTPGASAPSVLVGLSPGMRQRDTAHRVLAAHPSVTFTQVLRAGDKVLLRLEPAERAAPDSREGVLEQLSAKRLPPTDTAPAPEARPDRPSKATGSTTPPTRPGARGLGPLALAAAVALVVVAITVTSIGLALGSEALLVSVVLVLAVSQGLVLVGILSVVRLVRDLSREVGESRDDEATFRKQMRRRTDRLVRLSEEEIRLQREDLVAGQKARNEVAGVRKRVMSVGKLLSRAGAASRDTQPRDPPPT